MKNKFLVKIRIFQNNYTPTSKKILSDLKEDCVLLHSLKIFIIEIAFTKYVCIWYQKLTIHIHYVSKRVSNLVICFHWCRTMIIFMYVHPCLSRRTKQTWMILTILPDLIWKQYSRSKITDRRLYSSFKSFLKFYLNMWNGIM